MDFYEEQLPVALEDGENAVVHVTCRDDARGDRLLAIFPPHPNLGGNARNNVVEALARAGAADGWIAARLAYRGTHTPATHGMPSMAFWDDADARQDYDLVARDCLRMLAAARAAFAAAGAIGFAGYSFGVYLAAMVMDAAGAARLVGIAPPVGDDAGRATGAALAPRAGAVTLVVPAADPLCPAAAAAELAARWGAGMVPVDAEDHFFRGQEAALARLALARLAAPAAGTEGTA